MKVSAGVSVIAKEVWWGNGNIGPLLRSHGATYARHTFIPLARNQQPQGDCHSAN